MSPGEWWLCCANHRPFRLHRWKWSAVLHAFILNLAREKCGPHTAEFRYDL